ncbi:CDP-alcohol phosphatidyltransferase family protein [Candidatus Woesearchaeota archaeon]|nr:CDP-alcohol phosphatidyltransferase family protein [Candidatus Woesearchaeota archaeon]
MLGENLKVKIQKIAGSKIKILKKIGLTANKLTILSSLSILIAAYFFFKGQLITGGIFMLLDYLFDGIDGMFARMTNTSSKAGFILDHVSDYVIRRIWYFALAYSGFISYKIVSLAIFSLTISVFISNLAKIKKFKMPSWTMAWADWLIIPAVFTGQVVLFFQIMIIAHFILFIMNLSFMFYLNR